MQKRFDIDECKVFFVLFARFEYAMKAAGIRRVKGSGAIEANWSKLAEDVGDQLLEPSTENLKKACSYLLEKPPKRQDLDGDDLVWSIVPADKGSEAKDLFAYICRVRNNLFHGGKFKGRYLADTERSSELIGAATIVLNAVLQLCPNVQEAFHG